MPEKSRLRLYTVAKYAGAAIAVLTPLVTLVVTFGPLPGEVSEIKQDVRLLRSSFDRMEGGLKARGFLSDSGRQQDKVADASTSHNAD